MTSRPAALLLALTGWLAVAPLQPLAQGTTPIIERVGDTGFLQLQAESFKQLTPKQQALAYWLTQASIAIDPIAYDQFSATGIREKRVLEEIAGHPQGIAGRAVRQDSQLRLVVLGEPRQPQRNHQSEIFAVVHQR